jgi:hypothetical protein
MSFNPTSGYNPPDPDPDPAGKVYNLADPDPDRTFLGLLHRELNAATGREKETRASLAEHQAKADALTREREAIERAIRAYQGGAE